MFGSYSGLKAAVYTCRLTLVYMHVLAVIIVTVSIVGSNSMSIALLTLGACVRGTVVCVCVCVYICLLRANCYIHHFKVQGEVS